MRRARFRAGDGHFIDRLLGILALGGPHNKWAKRETGRSDAHRLLRDGRVGNGARNEGIGARVSVTRGKCAGAELCGEERLSHIGPRPE